MSTPLSRDRYIVRPLPDGDKRGYRLEIDEFIANNAMTNLFLIALSRLQEKSLDTVLMQPKDGGTRPSEEPNWANYYALAGIHSEPLEPWDGFPNVNQDPSEPGYCSHSLETFPTWHRPYMLLYESTIYYKMLEVANEFNKKSKAVGAKYLDAAAKFRLPYWDIVMPRKERQSGASPASIWGTPAIFAKKQVYVWYPDDPQKLVPIDNPLYSFPFPSADEYKSSQRTDLLVKMEGNYNTERTTRNANLDRTIQEQAAMFATKLGQMLRPDQKARPVTITRSGRGFNVQPTPGGKEIAINELRPWRSFSTTRYDVAAVGTNIPGKDVPSMLSEEFSRVGNQGLFYATASVESWHNALHNVSGQGQRGDLGNQIGNPAFAGFDPLFWMLHNNVDRILSLYQALYPDKWFTGNSNDPGTDPDEELKPFRKGPGDTCWRSNDDFVKSYWTPGFAVPGSRQRDPAAIKKIVEEYITNTYYWADTTNPRPSQLPNWPKKDNLDNCEALTGRPAPDVAPTINITAVTSVADKPTLVARKLTLAPDVAPQDKVIETQAVLQKVQALDEKAPEAAFQVAPKAPELTKQLTWNAHVRVRKYAFDGPFKVDFFIGKPHDDAEESYLVHLNEVGFVGIFAQGAHTQCANCVRQRDDEDLMVEDLVPLTPKLTEYLANGPGGAAPLTEGTHRTVENFEPGRVEPFLREQLKWRISDLRGNVIGNREQEAKLEVIVTSREYTSPTADSLLGTYGPLVPHPEVTSNKPGGLGYVYTDNA